MSQADDGARIDAFLDALWLEQGVSDHTLAAYRRDLAAWSARLAGRGEAHSFIIILIKIVSISNR